MATQNSMQYQIIPVTSYQQNCSLVWCSETKKAAFIDPGGDTDILIAVAEQNYLAVEQVILTHGHLDHVGGAKLLRITMVFPLLAPISMMLFGWNGFPGKRKCLAFHQLKSLPPNSG